MTLDCSASGSPEPVVTPLNNELPPNVAFVNDKYVITDGNTSNDGVYICQAENSVSVETLSFNVQFSGDCLGCSYGEKGSGELEGREKEGREGGEGGRGGER